MDDIRLKIVIINFALLKYETSTTGIILEVKVVFINSLRQELWN